MTDDSVYQFPVTRFVCLSPWRQWWSLLGVVLRGGIALLRGDLQQGVTELWRVKLAVETLQRILSGRGADVPLGRLSFLANEVELGNFDCDDLGE